MSDSVLVLESAPPREIISGDTAIVIAGWALRQGKTLCDAAVTVGEACSPAELQPSLAAWRWQSRKTVMPHLPVCGFQAMIRLPAMPAATQLLVRLQLAWNDGEREVRDLGAIHVVAPPPSDTLEDHRSDEQPLIAICMAVYSPDPDLFARQIESLRTQSHRNWICLIQDDASPGPFWDMVCETVAGDPRFKLQRNARNLGFYGNFERALWRVPQEASMVALADQDDIWYPEKLERLALEVANGATLAYCDSRVVAPDGTVLAESFGAKWAKGVEDEAALLLRNPVTGAACLFDRKLLETALPFPPKTGHVFYHDHWIAACAVTCGQVRFINTPLYDYVQHGSNAIGAKAVRPQRLHLIALAPLVLPLLHRLGRRVPLLARVAQARSEALITYSSIESRRIATFAATLLMRREKIAPSWRRRLTEQSKGWHAHGIAAWLLGMRRLRITEGAAAKLYAGRRIADLMARKAVMSRVATVPAVPRRRELLDNSALAGEWMFAKQRLAALRLVEDETQPSRINILLPGMSTGFLDSACAAAALAAEFRRRGEVVRLVSIAEQVVDPESVRAFARDWVGAGLEGVDLTSITDQTPLIVTRRDRFAACDVLSASLAVRAARAVGAQRPALCLLGPDDEAGLPAAEQEDLEFELQEALCATAPGPWRKRFPHTPLFQPAAVLPKGKPLDQADDASPCVLLDLTRQAAFSGRALSEVTTALKLGRLGDCRLVALTGSGTGEGLPGVETMALTEMTAQDLGHLLSRTTVAVSLGGDGAATRVRMMLIAAGARVVVGSTEGSLQEWSDGFRPAGRTAGAIGKAVEQALGAANAAPNWPLVWEESFAPSLDTVVTRWLSAERR